MKVRRFEGNPVLSLRESLSWISFSEDMMKWSDRARRRRV